MDFLYPPACVLCGEILPQKMSGGVMEKGKSGFNRVCVTCAGKVKVIREPVCLCCGKTVEDPMVEYCFDCEKAEFAFLRNRSVFEYSGGVRNAMHDFKYNHRKENILFFGDGITEHLGKWIAGLKVDVILPVPVHKRRRRRRGYNQAHLLAKYVSETLKIPMDTEFLYRVGNTKPQKELGKKERKINLKNAFKISRNELQYDRVLLIDDIYTTGATLDSAARALKCAGVREIYCVTACIGKGY